MYTPLKELQHYLQEQQIDVAYLSDPATISYFSGFQSDPHERILGLAVLKQDEPFLFTPFLEEEDARNSGWPYAVYSYQDQESPFQKIAAHIKASGDTHTIAIEKDHFTVSRWEALKQELNLQDAFDLTPEIQQIKVIKTPEEIEKMTIAGKWADKAIEIGCSLLREGITEAEVAAEIEYQLKKLGCEGMSFTTEVLFGDHAASPHGVPGDRQLVEGEFVLFDLGCVHEGYTSDMTRTVAFGTPSEEARHLYEVVHKAHLAAVDVVKPGVTAGEVDRAAREVIQEAGYGDYFTHRLGHGIGQSIHEFPNIMPDNPLVLEKGMCFSIEPGIYVPGVAGVRIEDCFYVTEDGCIPFTHQPKDYHEIKN